MSNEEVEVECPQCKEKFQQETAKLFPGSARACPHCASMLQFTGEDAGDVQLVQDEADDMDLGESLGDLGF